MRVPTARLTTALLTICAASLLVAGSGQATPADNKAAAIGAMTSIFRDKDPSGVDRYFAAPYIQHNTRAPDELDALRDLAKQATTWNGVHTTVHRALADGDLVLLHSTYRNLMGQKNEPVAFDLFRFKNGKIVEHWDALQPSEPPNPSGHTMTDGAVEITDRAKTESNRAVVRQFVEAVFIDGKLDQLDRFIDAKTYIQHNPRIGDGLTTLKTAFANRPPQAPKMAYIKVHATVAEGNFVFVQGEGRLGGKQVVEIYDLFRLKNGKIVEHWDVMQPLAPHTEWANPNGPF